MYIMYLLNTSKLTTYAFETATSFCQISNMRIIYFHFCLTLFQNTLSIIKSPRYHGMSVLMLLSGNSMQLGPSSCSHSKTLTRKGLYYEKLLAVHLHFIVAISLPFFKKKVKIANVSSFHIFP